MVSTVYKGGSNVQLERMVVVFVRNTDKTSDVDEPSGVLWWMLNMAGDRGDDLRTLKRSFGSMRQTNVDSQSPLSMFCRDDTEVLSSLFS